jgi:hypothetical protein
VVSAGCRSPRLGLWCCLLLLSIYQVKVIALETPYLLILRDEGCLGHRSAQKAFCFSELRESAWTQRWMGGLVGSPHPGLVWGTWAWGAVGTVFVL